MIARVVCVLRVGAHALNLLSVLLGSELASVWTIVVVPREPGPVVDRLSGVKRRAMVGLYPARLLILLSREGVGRDDTRHLGL
jgi:hypothetical protein